MLHTALAETKAMLRMLRETVSAFSEDRATRKGAALAYYTVFSLAPILMISISIAGFFFGAEAVRGEVVGQIRGLIGSEGARMVETLLANTSKRGTSVMAGIAGFVTLLFGATTALAELKDGLDQIWQVPAERTKGFLYTLRKRVLSIGLILALAFLLLVSLVFNAAVTALQRFWTLSDEVGLVLQLINVTVSFVMVAAMFAAIYKLLPATHIAWRDVIIGSIATAAMFTVGKYLMGLYLGNSAMVSAYGAAGSVILILLWVFYSVQIFFLGAEFTKIYAHHRGSRCPARCPEGDLQPQAH